jgi:hypothetical protein
VLQRSHGLNRPPSESAAGTTELPSGILKRIHVNQHVIRRNTRLQESNPPIAIKTSRANLPCFEVEIEGPSRLVYSPQKPLSCGARLWVETRAKVLAHH